MIPAARHLFLLLLLVLALPCLASRQLDKERKDIEGVTTNSVRARALLELADDQFDKDASKSLLHARDALDLARLAGDEQLEHEALQLLGRAQLRFGLYAEFLRTTLDALELSKARQDAVGMAGDLQDLALAYRLSLRPAKAIQESRNALAILLQTEDTAAIDQAYLRLMEELMQGGEHQEALRIGDQALERFREREDQLGQARVWLLIGEALSAQQKYADALPFLNRAGGVLDSIGTREDRFRLAVNGTRAEAGIGRQEAADRYLELAEKLARGVNDHRTQHTLLELRYTMARANGEWRQALEQLQALKAMDDSMHTARSTQQLAGLQTMYELDAKEMANQQLRERNDLNEERIDAEEARSEMLLMLLLGAVVLMAVLGTTFWNTFRVMRRLRLKNQVIRRQSEEIHAKNLELERKNLRLAESIVSEEQKELQLKEIHHRVKNNLQIVNTLLRLQGVHAGSDDTTELLEEAQNRIRSMALVHEHMYRSGDLREVDVRQFLEVLVEAILASYGLDDRVRTLVQSEQVRFSIDTLVPLSLLINELITNSAKHAFPGRRDGFLSIRLKRSGRGFELVYQDDGPGVGQERFFQGRSFGNQLVCSLAEQLNGRVGLEHADHTRVVLQFQPDELQAPLRAAS